MHKGRYSPKTFPLEGSVSGLSDNLLKQHQELYEKYVEKFNEIQKTLRQVNIKDSSSTYSTFRSLKVAETYTHNAAVLHEMYFENLSSTDVLSEEMMKEVEKHFQSFDKWADEFFACCFAARGWAIFGFNLRDGTLRNYILDSHTDNVPILVLPLLVFDAYEHSYHLDYGIDKETYISIFFDNVAWSAVEERLARVEQLL